MCSNVILFQVYDSLLLVHFWFLDLFSIISMQGPAQLASSGSHFYLIGIFLSLPQ